MKTKPIKLVLITSSNNNFIVNLAEQIAKIETVHFSDIIFWEYRISKKSRLKKNIKKHGLVYIPWRICLFLFRLIKKIVDDYLYKYLLVDEIEQDLFETCRKLNITIHKINKIHSNEGIELVSSLNCDILAVCGTGILRKEIFSLPSLGTINLHQGEVPKYRGAPPGFWELWNGEERAGVTIHFIDEGVDTGDIILQQTVPIYKYDNLLRVQDKLSEISIPLYVNAIKKISVGSYSRTSQAGLKGNQNFFPTLLQRLYLFVRIALRQFFLFKKIKSIIKLAAFPITLLMISLRDAYFLKVKKKKILSILYYHRVTDLCQDGMTIGNREFEKQIRFVRKHYDVISVSNIDKWFTGKSSRKGIIITFDDGYEDNFINALPVLRKYSCPAVFFVSTGLIGKKDRFAHDTTMHPDIDFKIMGWEQVKKAREEGIEIGVHTHTHVNLNKVKYEDAINEIDQSIDVYKQVFNSEPRMMSYPFGGKMDISEEIVNYIKENTHIEFLFSAYGNKNISPFNFFDLKRVNIGSSDNNLNIFWYKVEGELDTLLRPFEKYNFWKNN